MLPLKDNVPTRTFPVVTVGIIVVNVIVWIWEYTGTSVETDVIHYGENLWDYLDREGRALKYRPPVEAPARRVPFWSDLALNCDI
jgi:membrane associated rhomboid family serine protease